MMNKKGEALFVLTTVAGLFQAAFAVVALACIWHIPAWQKAKAEGKTAEYQAQKMWPQQWFAKLPGGDDYAGNAGKTPVVASVGNAGNFIGGNMNP